MTIDDHDVPGLYFGTSTGQLFASADEGESWSEIASYLPPIWSVEVAVVELAMADVHLPPTLTPLFAGPAAACRGRGGERRRRCSRAGGALARAPRPAVRAAERDPAAHPRVRRQGARRSSTADRGGTRAST